MTNENCDLMVTRENEMKVEVIRDGQRLVTGALEASRKPLHDLGNSLLDFFIDWAITKVSGTAS